MLPTVLALFSPSLLEFTIAFEVKVTEEGSCLKMFPIIRTLSLEKTDQRAYGVVSLTPHLDKATQKETGQVVYNITQVGVEDGQYDASGYQHNGHFSKIGISGARFRKVKQRTSL